MSRRTALGLTATAVTIGCGAPADTASGEAAPGVEVEYVAHAAFRVRSPGGAELLIDPYASRVWVGYDWPKGIEPDAVLITHPHYDHDAGRYRGLPFPWSPEVPVIDRPGRHQVGDVTVIGVEGKHADPYGKEFGQLNTIMVVEAAGLRLVHLGDNGPLTERMADEIGRTDVLFLPGDAVYHILSEETTREIVERLAPRVIVPMHYRLPDLEEGPDDPTDLGDVDPWLEGRPNVRRLGTHRTTLRAAELPEERTIMVFDHAPYVGRGG